jgi:hypothetical protein
MLRPDSSSWTNGAKKQILGLRLQELLSTLPYKRARRARNFSFFAKSASRS